jgi:hypothetical protein
MPLAPGEPISRVRHLPVDHGFVRHSREHIGNGHVPRTEVIVIAKAEVNLAFRFDGDRAVIVKLQFPQPFRPVWQFGGTQQEHRLNEHRQCTWVSHASEDNMFGVFDVQLSDLDSSMSQPPTEPLRTQFGLIFLTLFTTIESTRRAEAGQ